VVAFGHRPLRVGGRAIATHLQPTAAVGRTAVDLLRAKIAAPDIALPGLTLPGRLA